MVPHTKRLADHTREAVRRLNDGEEGELVVDYLRHLQREDGSAYYTVHSLATTICTVKRKAIESNRHHPEYDDSGLHRHTHTVPGVAEFLNASLLIKWKLQKAHKRHPSWPPEVERALAAIKLLPANLDSLKVTNTETETIKRAKRAARFAKMKAPTVIRNAASLLTRATMALENASVKDTYTQLATSLALVAGRRCTELLNGRSTFTSMGDRMVLFDGQLKKPIGQAVAYPIPLLCDTQTFLHGLAVLRIKQGDVSNLDNHAIQTRYYGHFSPDRMQLIMPGVTHFHLLRSMYCKFVDTMYNHKHSYNYLACQILGHDSVEESMAYVRAHLDNIDALRNTLGPLCV